MRSGAERSADRDVVVVGAGFAGLYAVHRLRSLGLDVLGIEAGDDVGGTWYWNRYPGAKCDVGSVEYSYSFEPAIQQEWSWSHQYASQTEIEAYAQFVADRLDLRRSIRFGTRVVACRFDEAGRRWQVSLDSGDELRTRFIVFATGALSVPKLPEIPGIGSFAGRLLHTARWPNERIDVGGQSVGVIGTGSSGIQAVPLLAEDAGKLTVFQRTPSFAIPARNVPLTEDFLRRVKENYPAVRRHASDQWGGIFRISPGDDSVDARPTPPKVFDVSVTERAAIYEEYWQKGGLAFLDAFSDLLTDEKANETAAEFVRSKIRSIVRDAWTAERLSPRGFPIGARRVASETGYYEAFNRPNVRLVDLKEDPIVRVRADGIETRSGFHALDVLVCATGFDAITGALLAIEIDGRRGTLSEYWRHGPRGYLGVGISGFPNAFIVNGPGSPSVKANMISGAEYHVGFIADLIAYMDGHGHTVVDVDPEAERQWVDHVNEIANSTLFPRAGSWYTGANVPGKPQVFMPYVGGVPAYRKIVSEVAAAGYAGFAFDSEAPGRARSRLSDAASA